MAKAVDRKPLRMRLEQSGRKPSPGSIVRKVEVTLCGRGCTVQASVRINTSDAFCWIHDLEELEASGRGVAVLESMDPYSMHIDVKQSEYPGLYSIKGLLGTQDPCWDDSDPRGFRFNFHVDGEQLHRFIEILRRCFRAV